MENKIIDNFLSQKSKVNLYDLKETIFQLKTQAREIRSNSLGEEYSFYDGQINAYCICLDLIECLEAKFRRK